MKCKICNQEIFLIPSAAERAAKDVTGKSAAYYTSLFEYHSACTIAKREASERALMERNSK